MHVTRSVDYGVRVMIELAGKPPNARVTAVDLARACGLSVTFVGKILQQLVHAQLLVSHTGRDGGFELERAARDISMLDIVSALDGPLCVNVCMPGGAGCARASTCSARGVWAMAQGAVAHVLASERLDRLAAEQRLHAVAAAAPTV